MSFFVGQDVGRYHIIEQLGQGGMATVYKAYDTRLERHVAIKFIRSDVFGSSFMVQILQRFEREAKALAKLSHHNIVKVYDYGEYKSSPYLVMEFLSGGTLKRVPTPLKWQDAVRMVLPVARGLAYAHRHSILHRDIKPANILFNEDDEPLLTDFGVAKILDAVEGQTLTGTGVGIGTPEYMAPEQWLGEASPQVDVYALGIVFYELVTGQKPFTADTPAAVLLKTVNDPLPHPSQYNPDLPEAVELVLFKALAKKPEDRFASMDHFISALRKLEVRALSEAVGVTEEGKPEPEIIEEPMPVSEAEGLSPPPIQEQAASSELSGQEVAQNLQDELAITRSAAVVADPDSTVAQALRKPARRKFNLVKVLPYAAGLVILGLLAAWLLPKLLPGRTSEVAQPKTQPASQVQSASQYKDTPTVTVQVLAPATATAANQPTPTESDPIQGAWLASGHSDANAWAFTRWNQADPPEISANCAKCHSEGGFLDWLGVDGTPPDQVDHPAALGTVITCEVCHNDTLFGKTKIEMTSGVILENLGNNTACIECHQGRSSKENVDAALENYGLLEDLDRVALPVQIDGEMQTIGFMHVHYGAAVVAQYGQLINSGYEYDGKRYEPRNNHVAGFDTCLGCHDPHSLDVDAAQCATCHESVANKEDFRLIREVSSQRDYDGDGDMSEGMYAEVQGLQDRLLEVIKTYASQVTGMSLAYNPDVFPFFYNDANNDGEADDYDAESVFTRWTGRLLQAAYNYQLSVNDPGGYAHGGKYIVQLLFDSIEDVNASLPRPLDIRNLARDDAGHFDGSAEHFRHWDSDEEIMVNCARCHAPDGLRTFITSGVNVPAAPGTGFVCENCHDAQNLPNTYPIREVTFPSGAVVSFSGSASPKANLCLVCHQGRESTTSLNNLIGDSPPDLVPTNADGSLILNFRAIHYFAAGATLFGTDVKGAYEYDGKQYVGRHSHAAKVGLTCLSCHDAHALTPDFRLCGSCHNQDNPGLIRTASNQVDFDGDGDVIEGMRGELETLTDKLYAAMQVYSRRRGVEILYAETVYPFYFEDNNRDGEIDMDEQGAQIRYWQWTPRLLKAAFNYHYYLKDPGAYVHNAEYMVQILYDSIQDIGGSVSGLTRP